MTKLHNLFPIHLAEGISFQGPGEDEMKEQQRVDPELAWVVRWRETGEEPTEGEMESK
jgi:hypothetical protein